MLMVPEGIKSRSFTLGVAQLSVIEQVAYDCIERIADEGREVSQQEIGEAIGYSIPATATGVINRLVAKGYVEHVGGRLQKALWLRIVATGRTTAEPRNKTPHWRYRTEKVPAPAIHRVAEHAKPLAEMIEAKASSLGKPLADFLMDCVYVGFHEICREGE
jgi:hypothetical protein